ncbi:MAG: ABC transporter ATP-binding protein [Dehalococcoidales bacterium]|jgi:lipooligosaccharide transport system ATP-binding protein|nr:ABC transporter ATP-binding protein [Dehalococcoidales bacterium]MDP7525505.1 ABC transporter ATP-binding protein [Dehalococcoidales bacterium]
MAVIETRNLTKKFKELVAVDGVNLEIEEGECFGLLGPNGSGKTTLIRMITAVSPPTGGEIRVLGKDLKSHSRQTKAALGVVPQIDNLDDDLTVLQNLTTFARYFAIPTDEAKRRSLEILELFQLEEKRDSHLRELSGGMKRRLLLARGLINQPRIFILDEPTVGLDPQAKHLVWRKLFDLKSQGVTQLLCTQNMEEAATLCDRVAIMHLGKIVSQDSPRALISSYVGDEVLEIAFDFEDRVKIIEGLTASQIDFVDAGNIIQVFHTSRDDLAGVLADLPARLRQRTATLEDVFFGLTGRALIE